MRLSYDSALNGRGFELMTCHGIVADLRHPVHDERMIKADGAREPWLIDLKKSAKPFILSGLFKIMAGRWHSKTTDDACDGYRKTRTARGDA